MNDIDPAGRHEPAFPAVSGELPRIEPLGKRMVSTGAGSSMHQAHNRWPVDGPIPNCCAASGVRQPSVRAGWADGVHEQAHRGIRRIGRSPR